LRGLSLVGQVPAALKDNEDRKKKKKKKKKKAEPSRGLVAFAEACIMLPSIVSIGERTHSCPSHHRVGAVGDKFSRMETSDCSGNRSLLRAGEHFRLYWRLNISLSLS
jgi:hypothetical protein